MASFRYTALNASGQHVDGVLSVASEQAALAELEARELTPVTISERRERGPILRRGVSGRALAASPALQAVYAAALVAALARIGAVLDGGANDMLLAVAGLAWSAAFLGFAFLYAPILCLPRQTTVRAQS